MKINKKVAEIKPSGIRKFFDIVSQMKDVISLGVGEPDFAAPWQIREQAIYTLERGWTHYTSNSGMIELRQAVSKHIQKKQSIKYDPKSQILIGVGVSELVDLAYRALLEKGDEVIVPTPCFVSYEPLVSLTGAKPVVIKTKVENNFELTALELKKKITDKTKAIILNYPNNPTGATISPANMKKICKLIVDNDLTLISDEIYGDLTYGKEHKSFAGMPGMKERTVLLNGFSKYYAMTGMRVGYACANKAIIAAMTKIHQYSIMCAGTSSQMAAIEALKGGYKEAEKMKEEYDQRRILIVEGLNEIGLKCFEPTGAFYAFPSVKKSGMDSEKFAEKLLMEQKVAVVPGTAFGDYPDFVRCSYATSFDEIKIALERMRKFLG